MRPADASERLGRLLSQPAALAFVLSGPMRFGKLCVACDRCGLELARSGAG
jgi:hypothetical protein